jgi:tripartite-type tricarboxylate transporter receptor subunit TctC
VVDNSNKENTVTLTKKIAAVLIFSWAVTVNATTEIVIAFPPGGVNDVVGRAASEYLKSSGAGESVVVNRPGGDGIIALNYALSSKNDTLTVASAGPFLFNGIVKKSWPVDVNKEFNLVVPLAVVPSGIIMSQKSGVTSLEQFIAVAKTRSLTCGITNQGTNMGLRTLLSKLKLEQNIVIVPYKGTAPAKLDLLGNHIDCLFEPISSFVQEHNANKLTVIAHGGYKTYDNLPQVALLSVTVKDFNYVNWFGIAMPKTMSAEKQQMYSKLLNAAPANLEFTRAINNAGMIVVKPSGDPSSWLNNERNKWDNNRKMLGIEKVD